MNDWLISNKLSVHLGKTPSIVFGTKNTLCQYNFLNSVCNGNVIESKSTITYLGVTLDQCLSGDAIASDILSKTSNLSFCIETPESLISKQKILVSS